MFFYRLIVNCDDHGRFDGRPSILRARLYPLKLDTIKESHINKWLATLQAKQLIYIYSNNKQQYIQLTTWENHQQIRAKRSKYPEPDINGNQLISDASKCTRNPIQSNPNPNPSMQTTACKNGHFDIFWKAYPRKKSKGDAEKAFVKIKPDKELLNVMLSKIEQAKISKDWLKDGGQYIPHPATWLNSKGWEDEYDITKTTEKPYTGR